MWQELVAESKARWRPEYPQLNNSVANGAIVTLGILHGGGEFRRHMGPFELRRTTDEPIDGLAAT
jgi:hypothetical protein